MAKFQVTFKDPDGPYDCIQEEARRQVNAIEGIDEDEKEDLISSRVDKIKEVTGRWFQWGEYVTIEIDTETGTATVMPARG